MNPLLWLAPALLTVAQAAHHRAAPKAGPEYIVGQLMDSYPRAIGLTAVQKSRMRAVYLHLVTSEESIVKHGGSKFSIRGKVHVVETVAQTKLKKILAPHQYVMIENWQENRRHAHPKHP